MNINKVDSVKFKVRNHIRDFHESLINKTIKKINVYEDKYGQNYIILYMDNGNVYALYHEQDCSEDVRIEDIVGNLDNLIDNPVTLAEVATNHKYDKEYASQTWSFYKLATVKGYVTIRWYGNSNGYYSEEVGFYDIEKLNIKEEENVQ